MVELRISFAITTCCFGPSPSEPSAAPARKWRTRTGGWESVWRKGAETPDVARAGRQARAPRSPSPAFPRPDLPPLAIHRHPPRRRSSLAWQLRSLTRPPVRLSQPALRAGALPPAAASLPFHAESSPPARPPSLARSVPHASIAPAPRPSHDASCFRSLRQNARQPRQRPLSSGSTRQLQQLRPTGASAAGLAALRRATIKPRPGSRWPTSSAGSAAEAAGEVAQRASTGASRCLPL